MIEMLVVIAVLGILAGLAIWSMVGILPKWRLEGAANEVVTQFQFARSSAVRANKTAIVQFVSVGSSTSSGIRVWIDEDMDSVASGGDTMLNDIVIPSKHKQAYVQTATDGGGGSLANVAISSAGAIKSINGGAGSGAMPLLIKATSLASTTPSTYTVRVSRSGVAKIE